MHRSANVFLVDDLLQYVHLKESGGGKNVFSLRDGLVFECKDEVCTETKKPFDKDKADVQICKRASDDDEWKCTAYNRCTVCTRKGVRCRNPAHPKTLGSADTFVRRALKQILFRSVKHFTKNNGLIPYCDGLCCGICTQHIGLATTILINKVFLDMTLNNATLAAFSSAYSIDAKDAQTPLLLQQLRNKYSNDPFGLFENVLARVKMGTWWEIKQFWEKFS